MATDPIKIPIIAEDKASADIKKVATEADKLDKKKVKVGVDTDQSTGMIGKLKGAIGSIGPMVAGAGAAVGTVAAAVGNMVGSWQSLALEVGHFRDAAGVSADTASRFVELSKDMGLSVSDVESMIGKLNKTASTTPGVFDKWGVSIATTATGATDVQQTFLNAVDAISNMKDPADQAAAATALFGKSWQNAAELIVGGADNVKQRLDSLKGTKLVDDSEIDNAKKVRDQFDRMHDSIDELSNIIGEKLAPALGDAAEEAGKLGETAGPLLSQFIAGGVNQLKLWNPVVDTLHKGVSGLGSLFDQTIGKIGETRTEANKEIQASNWGDLRDIIQDISPVAVGTAAAIDTLTAANDRNKAAADRNAIAIGGMQKSLQFDRQKHDVLDQIYQGMLKVHDGTQLSFDEINNMKQAIVELGITAGMTPVEIKTELDKVDAGDLQGAFNAAQGWADRHPVTVKFRFDQNIAAPPSPYSRAGATSVSPTAAGATAQAVGIASLAAPTVTVPIAVPNVKITVNAGMVTDTASLVRSLTRAERQTSRLLGTRWREVAVS